MREKNREGRGWNGQKEKRSSAENDTKNHDHENFSLLLRASHLQQAVQGSDQVCPLQVSLEKLAKMHLLLRCRFVLALLEPHGHQLGSDVVMLRHK